MARTIKKRKKIDAWKTKSLYDIFAPKMFGEVKIGETLASDASSLVGRVVETTARDLTNDFSKQHIKLRFQIIDIKGDRAYTKFKGHSLSRDYMRSQIRRKTTRVERVTDVETKDAQKLRVKTIALAVGRAQTAQEKLIRKIMSDRVTKTAKKLNLDQFMQEVVIGKISSDMYKAASKIYPLKRVEVRKVKVLKKKPEGEIKEIPQYVEVPIGTKS